MDSGNSEIASIPSAGRLAEGPTDGSFIAPALPDKLVSVQTSPIAWAAQKLEGAGIESPRLEAQLLLALALNVSRTAVVAELYAPLTEEQLQEFERLVELRAGRFPLAYLRGSQEFYGLPFRVTPAVLIPRPETELLVEFALEKLNAAKTGNKELPPSAIENRQSKIENPLLFDVGTGSGCILTAILANFPEAQGLGFDLSLHALEVARYNARQNGVEDRARFVVSDLLAEVDRDCCDVIVSNPPYIPSGEIPALQPEVRNWEPILALDGGADGLILHRRLAMQAFYALRPGGWLGVETAMGQAADVAEILRENGFAQVTVRRDLAGIERIVCGQKPAQTKEDRNG